MPSDGCLVNVLVYKGKEQHVSDMSYNNVFNILCYCCILDANYDNEVLDVVVHLVEIYHKKNLYYLKYLTYVGELNIDIFLIDFRHVCNPVYNGKLQNFDVRKL